MFLYTAGRIVNVHRNPTAFKEAVMKFNVGTPDRIARLVIGAVLVLLPLLPGIALFANPLWFWASLVVGVVLIGTALVRFCPLYAILGLSTCKVPSR
jgi:hypothetical protein